MGNNAVIVQILAVVLILFFCFVTYMNTKTWRATHVTFLFLVFGAGLVFSVYAALVLKTRQEWLKKVQELEENLVVQTEKGDELLYGDKQVPKTKAGVSDLRAGVQRTVIDRGRVWRDVVFKDAQTQDPNMVTGDATVVVNLSTIPPGNVGERVEPNHMEKDTVVYAFKDMDPNAPHTRYAYVGEFSASAVTDTSITLTSNWPLPALDQRLVAGNQMWVLYERMPTDSHDVFSFTRTPKEGDPDESASRKDEALIRADISPDKVLNPLDFLKPESYQAVLREYNRDGKTLDEVIKDRAASNDPPLSPDELQNRTFAKVKFLKAHTLKVDAAAPRAAATDTSVEAFDSSGQALDPRLRRGGVGEPQDVEFKVGDTAELILNGFKDKNGAVIEKGAEELREEGIVQIDRIIYRRPLHDYAYEFKHMQARKTQVREALRLVNHEIGVVQEEIKKAEANTEARKDERTKLADDQTRLLAEKEKIQKYHDDLEAAYRASRAELSRLYRENAALHEKIVAANEKLAREIEDRVASPTSLER